MDDWNRIREESRKVGVVKQKYRNESILLFFREKHRQ